MGRGGHGDDEGTPYDQTLDELDFLRSACAAAQRGQAEQLRALLTRRGASVALGGGAVGGRGYTPLHYAAREGRLECAQILLDAGACRASARPGRRVCSQLLSAFVAHTTGAAVDARTAAGGATALHRAAFTGRVDVVALLCVVPPKREACGVRGRSRTRPRAAQAAPRRGRDAAGRGRRDCAAQSRGAGKHNARRCCLVLPPP